MQNQGEFMDEKMIIKFFTAVMIFIIYQSMNGLKDYAKTRNETSRHAGTVGPEIRQQAQ